MTRLLHRSRFFGICRLNMGTAAVAWKVNLDLDRTASIDVSNGFLKIGYPLDSRLPFACLSGGMLKMGKNARIVVKGNVSIAPGCSIVVRDGGVLEFEGSNLIAHNSLIHCHKSVLFKRGASSSWDCKFLDWDGHLFTRMDGSPSQKSMVERPLIIGRNVGIQMNVLIPRGLEIGDESIIGANTTLRENIPPNCLAFTDSQIKVKHGYRSGLETK